MSLTPEEGEKEVVYTPTVESAELTVEEEMRQALARVSLTDQKIAEMVELAATITTPTNLEEEHHAEKVLADVSKWRILGMKNVSKIHKRFVDMWKLSGRVSKDLEARLSEPELLIEAKLLPWRQEQERKRKEEEELIAAEKERRQDRLLELRCTFVPGPPEHRYVCGTGGWSAREVIEADHQTWLNMERAALLVCEELERKEAEEREKKEAEEQERQRREKEISDREAQLAKERNDMIMERGQMRIEKLENALGAKRDEDGVIRVDGQVVAAKLDAFVAGSLFSEDWDKFFEESKRYANLLTEAKQKAMDKARVNEARKNQMLAVAPDIGEAGISAILNEGDFTDEEWDAWVLRLGEEYKQRIADKATKELIGVRVTRLKQAGWVEAIELSDGSTPKHNIPSGTLWIKCHDDDRYFRSEDIAIATDESIAGSVEKGLAELARRKKAEEDRIAADAASKALEQAEEQRAQAVEAEKRRQAQLGDVEKWTEWVATVKASAPKMESATGNHAIGRVIAGLDAMTPKLIEDIKK